jgi:hypothetical protein
VEETLVAGSSAECVCVCVRERERERLMHYLVHIII